ncbi:MAG TPA: transglutaminase-like domain-containing protein [Ramlibacter sp.]|nr:transglutaminase-like domain-containing protein [Ramlibacter sp.]
MSQAPAPAPVPDSRLDPADDPRAWLGNTPLLDLDDPKLRLKAHSLTQLCKSEREKALAIYGFVKRLPLRKAIKLRQHSPREVLEAGEGDADDKATLLIALLRAAGIPARLRYVELHRGMLRGLVSGMTGAARPLAEVWLGRWMRTDTYIFDAGYMAAARQRLKDKGWSRGYGIHVGGDTLWAGVADSYLGGEAPETDPMVLRELGTVNDPQEALRLRRGQLGPLMRALHWSMVAPGMGRAIRELREQSSQAPATPAPSPSPARRG